MNETADLEQLIRQTIKSYRAERGYFGGSGVSDRDQTNLVHRIKSAITERLEEIDDQQTRELRAEIERLGEELELAKGAGYGELRQEYEAQKALAKHLIYRLGKEDDAVKLSVDDLTEMEERVDMQMTEEDGVITIRLQEYD